MTRTLIRNLVLICAIGLVGCSAQRAMGGDHCLYKGSTYSDGAASCQSAIQYRCEDGEWRTLGIPCSGSGHEVTASRSCQFSGISFSTGAASCQAGTQFRCEDGEWRSLEAPCAVGDSPIKLVPSGRTCMFNDATVANNSTICRSGTTFLCSDGDWVNLGTMCR